MREDRNVGALVAVDDLVVRRVAEVAEAARARGVQPKAHNCDYLSPWALRVLGRTGVQCNIAPQYAVTQNRLLARLLAMHANQLTVGRVREAVAAAGGWRRWTDDLHPPAARVMELGAHYAMSDKAVRDVMVDLDKRLIAANLPGFYELSRRALRQLMLQQTATLEGVAAPCL